MLIEFITAWTCESEASPPVPYYALHRTDSVGQILTSEAHVRLSLNSKDPPDVSLEAEFGLPDLQKHKYYPQ